MNRLESAITDVLSKSPPSLSPALTLCHLILRGGTATEDELVEDHQDWILEHGELTREKLFAWARERTMDADIAEAVRRAR